jgi:hypothetical protein
MDHDFLESEINCLFNPEPDEDQSPREWPNVRLETHYGLNFEFMKGFHWEGSTGHPNTRICLEKETALTGLTRNDDVPRRLFEAALRVFGDSMITYNKSTDHVTRLRYYPPIILTFWSAFEAFVRHSSELMVRTSKDLPSPVSEYLRERSPMVNSKGTVEEKTRYQPVLDRYVVLLRYGFDVEVKRGDKYWQRLEDAKRLRDYYTHIEAMNSRSVSDKQVMEFMESVLLGIIWPSEISKRTLLLGVHDLYDIWASLSELTALHLPMGHTEEPFFHSWGLDNVPYMFYCPFVAVDTERFPNSKEEREQRERLR